MNDARRAIAAEFSAPRPVSGAHFSIVACIGHAITPSSIALFIVAQMAGLGAGLLRARVLFPPSVEDRARR